MPETLVITVVGGLAVSLLGWHFKTELSSVVTTTDVDPEQTPTKQDLAEVRSMAQSAKRRAEDAHATAESARSEIQSLSELLVENSTEADEPLLVRMQDRLVSIEAELQRQSRVETERAVTMGRLARALEDIDGVDADDVDVKELYDRLPDGGEKRA